jgi:hypothetical protein
MFADEHVAWEGTLPGARSFPARIEAAAYHGQPVSFDVVMPWTKPDGRLPSPGASRFLITQIGLLAIVTGVIGFALFSARRNLRLGRGDRRGATRLAATVGSLMAIGWLLTEHHVPTIWELALIGQLIASSLTVAALLWMLYIAFEPFIRRQMPYVLVSWTRFITGDWRDPLCGRDVLAGCAAGALGAFLASRDLSESLAAVQGPGAAIASLVSAPFAVGPILVLVVLAAFVVLRMLFKRDHRAAIAFVLLVATPPLIAAVTNDSSFAWRPLAIFGLILLVVLRFGLLGGLTMGIVEGMFVKPLTFEPTWYSGVTYAVLAIVAALSLYAFRTALGNRPVFNVQTD